MSDMWTDAIYTQDMGQAYADDETLHQWHYKILRQHYDPTEPEAGTIQETSGKKNGFDSPEELVKFLKKKHPDKPILGLGAEYDDLVKTHNDKIKIPEWL